MKIQQASEITITVTPTELKVIEFVLSSDGEELRDILKPMFKHFVRNLNYLGDNDQEEQQIKAELPSLMQLIDILEINYNQKAIKPLKEVA